MITINRRTAVSFVLGGLLTSVAGVAHATDWSKLNAGKKTKLGLYIIPKEAFDYVQKNKGKTLFVDVRTPGELAFLGTPTITGAHVPYELMDTSRWDDKKHEYRQFANPNFVAEIDARMKQKGLGKNDTVILMCRSGSRSAAAANALAAAGYTRVYNQVEGFEGDKMKDGPTKGQRAKNGWKNAGLPWSYKLDKAIMYLTK